MVVLIIIGFVILFIAVIGSWMNTLTILKDLNEIKKEIGIKERKQKPFIINDLDNE
ncbi:hypothetical protein ACLIBG_04710 [Virgibacillus sp. W0181]|uniref:hypothetical protein n=1 Tax=Virgibacillus sp. W0181 TaxID=3391581 RepID=UPI003F45049D